MKNCYFSFICLKFNNLLIMKSIWNRSKKSNLPTFCRKVRRKRVHICWLPPPCLRYMKEAGVWKKQLLSSQKASLCGKICPSCWKTEKYKICLPCLPLSENTQFQTHLQQWLSESLWKCLSESGACDTLSPALQQRSNVHLLHRTASVSEMHQSCRSQGSSDSHPVWVVLSTQHAKTPRLPPLFKAENTLKYRWTPILYSLFQVWNHPCLASELLLWV